MMDALQSAHLGRMRRLRESFAEANERLVARLRGASDEAAGVAAPGQWSAAQIGWHVAAATTKFAGLISGDTAGAQPLPEDFREREWAEVVAAVPALGRAPEALVPPPNVRRNDAISALEASGLRMARAFDSLTAERGRMGITHAVLGALTVYQIGEWATAHVIRHNRQAKRVLGQG
jgi:hypothetical protein